MGSVVALVKCADYSADRVEQAIRQAVGLLGGIEKFIKPNSRVLVKPNLLTAKEPESGITTHPQIVRAVIHLLKDINVHIYLGDSPSAWLGQEGKIELVWEKCGMEEVARKEKVELVKFEQKRWHKNFPLTTLLTEVDYLVSVPKFKTHDLTVLTGAIKNLYGLIPGTYKMELHKRYPAAENFSRILVDLYEITKPALTIIDGIVALEGEGPGSRGQKKNLGLIAAGSDCVSIDSVLALIMGLRPADILTNREAARRNLGSISLKDIQMLGESLSSFQEQPFKLPVTTFKYRISQPLIKLVGRLIRFYPSIDLRICSRCQACIHSCPQRIIKEKDGKVVIDYSGCIYCFCCQEVCPAAAINVKKSMAAKLLKL
jgi:uncharacterized protein (DUF362 family)/NAD-dependent dihydropyrimidine dehydrogenase PreA subunit